MKLNRISLNTIGLNRIGLNRIGSPSRGSSSGSVRPYIDPEVLASLVAVVKCDGKSNNDPDRAVIKNLVDPDNPFVISNAAYKLNSGFGKYEEDFSIWRNSRHIEVEYSNDGSKLKIISENVKDWWLISPNDGISNSFRVKITNCRYPIIWRYTDDGNSYKDFLIDKDGIYDLPQSISNNEGVVNRCYFGSYTQNNDYTGLTIEQIPSFQGAFYADGVNDMITSTKTMSEMLGGGNKCTVISFITHISGAGKYNIIGNGGIQVSDYSGQTFMAGCSSKSGEKIVELGDKEKIQTFQYTTFDSKLSIGSLETGLEISSYAYYGTFVFNKDSVPIDWIHQVIAYFYLDKYVTADIIYDTIRQGITNENHASFNDELVDFSGNGHNLKIYNSAWKLGSGVGKYEADYSTWTKVDGVITTPTGFKIVGQISSTWWLLFLYNTIVPAHKIKVSGIPAGGKLAYDVTTNLENGINELPEMEATSARGFTINLGTTQFSDWTGLSVEQISDYGGALVFDAVDDYGQFVGDLGLKDYTIAIDRAYVEAKASQVPIISNAINLSDSTPFIMEYLSREMKVSPNSFGVYTTLSELNINRFISYQNTYKYGSTNITRGTSTDTGSGLTIGRKFGSSVNYCNIALWSLLLFPYSLSEFLLERQLKRYKLGTLHPDMVEVRPIINSTGKYFRIEYRNGQGGLIQPGSYLPVSSILRISVVLNNNWDEVSSLRVNGVDIPKSSYSNNNFWIYDATVTKSPQKIDITIDEYIRYEDIVQPYPFIFPIVDANNKVYSWGDKIKVGTEIKFAYGSSLLPQLYELRGEVMFNGNAFDEDSKHIIGKTNIFTLTEAPKYLKDNEPNCILAPQILRIPNASYKILGYIPDLTGKGNHGKINNSAYAGMSGANGYNVDFTTWRNGAGAGNFIITDNYLKLLVKHPNQWLLSKIRDENVERVKFVVTGIPSTGELIFQQNTVSENVVVQNNTVFEVGGYVATRSIGFLITVGNNELDWSNLVIQQIGEHEGSFCLDGVDDFITIPTLEKHGGKQVLMKVNYRLQNHSCTLYDQRIKESGWQETFAIVSTNSAVAYSTANSGKTYIDGILNTNIIGNTLANITHNLTIINENVNENNTGVINIGAQAEYKLFGNMSLFAFMSFPEISSEDEIKELNDIVGIEGGYVESPDYYWDMYGKNNNNAFDIEGNKYFIPNQVQKQNGISPTNAEALAPNNFAFNEESGYGGQKFILPFAKPYTGGWNYTEDRVSFEPLDNGNSVRITEVKSGVALFWAGKYTKIAYYKVTGVSTGKGIKFGSDSSSAIWSKVAEEDGIYEIDWSLNVDSSGTVLSTCILSSGFRGECDIVIEQVPQYPNGLVSDGVEDYLSNTAIPAFTDFTVIAKRTILDTPVNSAFCCKGEDYYTRAAFMLEFRGGSNEQVASFGTLASGVNLPDLITFMTATSYNGRVIGKGTIEDTVGLWVGRYNAATFWKGVFYKMMLYSKTIDKLSINMLKNLFAKDELIDVNNPIFKK